METTKLNTAGPGDGRAPHGGGLPIAGRAHLEGTASCGAVCQSVTTGLSTVMVPTGRDTGSGSRHRWRSDLVLHETSLAPQNIRGMSARTSRYRPDPYGRGGPGNGPSGPAPRGAARFLPDAGGSYVARGAGSCGTSPGWSAAGQVS